MNSKILLVKNIKIDREYTNVLSYTENQMLQLCRENLVAEANNYSFIRQTNTINVAFTYSQCLQANYIAFQNSDYSNKWFFAWIDDVIYRNDKTTEITFTVDSWSTWFDYWQKKPCFITRQHVNDDTIGLHTLDENLDVGDVVCNNYYEDESYSNRYGFWVAMETSWIINNNSHDTTEEQKEGKQFSGCTMYNKGIWGNIVILFHINDIEDLDNISYYLYRTAKDGHINDIYNLFIVPDVAINQATLQENIAYVEDKEFTFFRIPANYNVTKFDYEVNKPENLGGYVPKNNKLHCFPYNYLLVSNNNGNQNIYKYEDFYNQTICKFENDIMLSISMSGKVIPKNYKKMDLNYDEGISVGKYPVCAWSSDAFTNWLTQNAVNMPNRIMTSILSSSLNLIGVGNSVQSMAERLKEKKETSVKTSSQIGILSSVANTGMSVVNDLNNAVGELKLAKLLPNVEGGQNTGDVNWSSGNTSIVYKQMSAKLENLKIIDDYFSRVGYKINRIELPNITGRRNWNYIEISDREEIGYGSVPSKFMQIINTACRNGVTIWHNHTNLGNYSLDNDII